MQDVSPTKIASKQKLTKQQLIQLNEIDTKKLIKASEVRVTTETEVIKALSPTPEPVSKPLTTLEIIRLKGKIEKRKRVLDGLERRRQKQIKIMTDFTNDKDNNYYLYAVENILNFKDLEREKDKQAKLAKSGLK